MFHHNPTYVFDVCLFYTNIHQICYYGCACMYVINNCGAVRNQKRYYVGMLCSDAFIITHIFLFLNLVLKCVRELL